MHLRRGRGCGYALAIQCNGPRTGNQRQPDRSMGPDQGYDLRPVLAASIRARMADRMGAGREGQAARTWTRSGSRGGSEVHAGVHATAFDREEFSCDDRNLFYGNEVRVPPEGLEPSAL